MAEPGAEVDRREMLLDIIASEGLIHREKLRPDATLESLGVASYDMVMILMAIEEKFGVYISVDTDLSDARTLDELLAVLNKRIEAGAAPAAAGDSTQPPKVA